MCRSWLKRGAGKVLGKLTDAALGVGSLVGGVGYLTRLLKPYLADYVRVESIGKNTLVSAADGINLSGVVRAASVMVL